MIILCEFSNKNDNHQIQLKIVLTCKINWIKAWSNLLGILCDDNIDALEYFCGYIAKKLQFAKKFLLYYSMMFSIVNLLANSSLALKNVFFVIWRF